MTRKFSLLRNTFAALLLTGFLSMPALAHNHLVKTEPAASAALKTAPMHITLWFEEKPDLTVTKIEVKGPRGAVESGPIHMMPNNAIMADFKGKLAGGEYVVTWQTAGDDSHISKGTFTFSVAGVQ